ncbi:MAG: hypothetical protein AAFX58_03525 [Pseudomonadota bacterium]
MSPTPAAILMAGGAFVAGLIVARLLWSWVDQRRLERAFDGGEHVRDSEATAPGVLLKLQRRLAAETEHLREALNEREQRLDEFRAAYEQRAGELDLMRRDVRDAVAKTRELREELIDRATESARARERLMQMESRLQGHLSGTA